MARVTDETVGRSLGLYAGMAHKILGDPERWLGDDDDPEEAPSGRAARALDAVRDRFAGKVSPASADWSTQPVAERVDWWVDRITLSAGLAAAAPRFAGALADRVPLQAALGASAAGLAVCAAAREHGVTAPADWVPLLAKVLFDRELPPAAAAVPPATEAEEALLKQAEPGEDQPAEDQPGEGEPGDKPTQEEPSRVRALGRAVQNSARTIWRLAGTFRGVQDLLDERPRGGLFARGLAKLPVVGVAGGWLDERGAIHKAARETGELLAAAGP